MKLVSILNEELIFTSVDGENRFEIYRDMLQKAQAVLDLPLAPAEAAEAMIQREELLDIPYEGCAMPHLRRGDIEDFAVIIGILPVPVRFRENDLKPCRLVVMSLVSPETSDLYLKTISAIARYLQEPNALENLVQVKNAAAFMELIQEADVTVHNNIVAQDVMVVGERLLRENDTLSTALDMFSNGDSASIPVLDKNDRLVGEITAMDILKNFIPEYIFRMDNLDFLTSFEPFNRIFQEENQHVVRDYMHPPQLTVHPETPLIQFTVRMMKKGVRTCFVVDEHRKYVGEIIVKHIVKKVLRG